MLDPHARLRPKPGYALELFDDEAVIVHPANEAVFYCNVTAALVFRLCDGERDIAAIVALLREAYPDAGEQLEAEVQRTLAALLGHGALESS